MTHRSRLAGIILDCRTEDPEGAAAFWAGALGLAAEEREGPYVALGDTRGGYLAVQKVEHESRVHLDIESDDVPAEVARLERLGARKVAEVKTWVVMEAPTGHRFCVVRAGSGDFAATAKVWEGDA